MSFQELVQQYFHQCLSLSQTPETRDILLNTIENHVNYARILGIPDFTWPFDFKRYNGLSLRRLILEEDTMNVRIVQFLREHNLTPCKPITDKSNEYG